MARVTVEDCIEKIPNRFKLVMVAAQRARQIVSGVPLTVERDDDKNPVVALREIADETIDIEAVEQAMILGLQKHGEQDDPEDEDEMQQLPASEQVDAEVASGMPEMNFKDATNLVEEAAPVEVTAEEPEPAKDAATEAE